MGKWKPYQTDHLFLIVGSNPLPNYVAASLLSKENGNIYLLHTRDTFEVATRLKKALESLFSTSKAGEPIPNRIIKTNQIDYFQKGKIVKGVEEFFTFISNEDSVGLNYTGGTKAMAVHVYTTINEKYPDAVFSYLDARSLSIRFDRRRSITNSLFVEDDCRISLEELIKLHFTPDRPLNIKREPRHPELCNEILKIHLNTASFDEWHKEWPGPKKKTLKDLPDRNNPIYKGFLDRLDIMCGGKAVPDSVASLFGFSEIRSCKNWLSGVWLEDYTLWALTEIAESVGLRDEYGMMPNEIQDEDTKRKFQVDLAAVKGYQLFAISCIASDNRCACKRHLFEAYIRAMQLGGDEARVGLVCCHDHSEILQQEIEEEWFTEGRVRVFGRDELENLPEKLKEWFETANRNITYGGY